MNSMKTTTKIRQDAHGPYVRTNGNIYRPYLCQWSYAVMQPLFADEFDGAADEELRQLDRTFAWTPDPTLFAYGEPVKARAVSQTPYARVGSPDGRKAFWWGHGDVFVLSGSKTTEACWHPQK